MKHRVEMAARAEMDVDETLAWLSRKGVSLATANRWHARLLAAVATLESKPERCGLAPEAEEAGVELRELHFGRRQNVYRILFIVDQDTVIIVRIRHAARDMLSPEDLG